MKRFLLFSQLLTGLYLVAGAAGLIRVSIADVLSNREKFKGARVEVVGYLKQGEEFSALYETEEDAKQFRHSKSLWVHPFRVKNGCEASVRWTNNAMVRVVGTFTFRENLGSGHLNSWPAELTDLESLGAVQTAADKKPRGEHPPSGAPAAGPAGTVTNIDSRAPSP